MLFWGRASHSLPVGILSFGRCGVEVLSLLDLSQEANPGKVSLLEHIGLLLGEKQKQ
tara:strand:+ start:487 stop:657 length:171 start_codon:yes stop_codon:yes gene_type:complete